jgi:acyl carrier protein
MDSHEELKADLKRMLVETLNLTDVRPEDIGDDQPLFGTEPLNLDSIDALEIFQALQKRYGIRVDGQNMARTMMESVDRMADFIRDTRASAGTAGTT